MRQSALVALLAGALPLSLLAQVRRPDTAPAGGARRTRSSVPVRRTELSFGIGTSRFEAANATSSSLPMLTLGLRRQFSPEWLHVGATVDAGTTKVNGAYFPYENRPVGDSLQFVAVGGTATMIAGRLSLDAIKDMDDDRKYRAGVSLNGGLYAMLPSPAGGANAGTFVAPTYGIAVIGMAELTKRLGATASFGIAQFMNFDRDKIRPSDPALEDPAFVTPFTRPPAAVKNFGGPRMTIGLTYRLGVKRAPAGGAR
ncbi:MAG: hypothetical protein IT355_11440 [Gemmatimonadaceae bacterium]|nr:hypothetical protein [Gemmatimonadaceae bacterium]